MGWVIHSADWTSEKTKIFDNSVGLTASLDIIKAIAEGKGPKEFLFCLGYSGWAPLQLMNEIRGGFWLNIPFDKSYLFNVSATEKWSKALEILGVGTSNFSPVTGGA
jgi:putative transcriptional regulator